VPPVRRALGCGVKSNVSFNTVLEDVTEIPQNLSFATPPIVSAKRRACQKGHFVRTLPRAVSVNADGSLQGPAVGPHSVIG
jgi:hypothetical protein